MEVLIWEGKASWLSGISVLDIVLIFITMGLWIFIPIIKIIGLTGKQYRVTTERIIIKEGIVSTSENEIEYYRIKNLSVTQSMMQKIFNIGNISIQSAGLQNANLEMTGIPNAYALREEMRTAVNNTRKDNNVRISENI